MEINSNCDLFISPQPFNFIQTIKDELMFVAFARPNKAFSNGEAYRQSYYQLDVRKLFDEVLTPQKLS